MEFLTGFLAARLASQSNKVRQIENDVKELKQRPLQNAVDTENYQREQLAQQSEQAKQAIDNIRSIVEQGK